MRLGGTGLQDWLMQRLTALVIAAYTVFLLAYILCTREPIDFGQWQGLFARTEMKIATILTLVAVAWHAWIGVWTVSTDYIKCRCLRLPFQWAVIAALALYIIWGVMIVWSNVG